MNNKELMEKGLLYDSADENILKEQFNYIDYIHYYNDTKASEQGRRSRLLKKMFASVGEDCYIEAPMFANWGGHHVHLGDGVYANFNLTLVDDGNIYIGDHTMIGPNVTIATASHPIHPSYRDGGLQYNLDVHIGKCVWIAAGVIVCPGVTIGDNSVIGAGSVVTRNIPENVVAVGNPCKVLREINEHDKEYYYKDFKFNV